MSSSDWTNFTTEDDERLARAQAVEHPPSFAAIFGDLEGDVPVFKDQPPEPGPHSSAVLISRYHQEKRAAATEARQLSHLTHLARERQEDEALDAALAIINRGGRPSRRLRTKAMAALNRRGGSDLSSAEMMAAQALRGWS